MTSKNIFVLIGFVLFSAMGARADVCGSTPGNLVANCGFETGTFANWTLSGTNAGPAYDGIAHGVDAMDTHSGNFGAYLGGFGGILNLNQTIQTVPGALYTVTYWLSQTPATIAPYQSSFSFSFGGSLLMATSQLSDLPYTQYNLSAIATSTTTSLVFGFRDDTGLFSIDDISVTTSSAPEPSSMKSAGCTFAAALIILVLPRARISRLLKASRG